LFRGKQGPDFSDRDLFLLRLIKDHLALRLYQDYSVNKRKKPDSDIRLYAAYNLTAREIEILLLMLERYSNDEMADYLHVSHFTVQKHVSNIYKKLNVNSKSQLFKLCSEIGQI
jgi:DNA-binding CsgD family transcriptional regulator